MNKNNIECKICGVNTKTIAALSDSEKDDWIQLFSNKTSYEVELCDLTKLNLIKSLGYEVLIVWEDDYNENYNGVIENCIDFLRGANNGN